MKLAEVIDFGLADEQRDLRASLRRFGASEIVPAIDEYEREGRFPRPLVQRLAEIGVLGALIPERYGGAALDYVSYGLVCEEVAYADWVLGSVVSVLNSLVASAIMAGGSEEQCERFLPGLASGRRLAAACLTEPGGGSDLAAIRTTARSVGDEYVISGAKTFISHADQAEVLVVLATIEPSLGRRGLTAFAVEAPTEGLEARPIRLVGLRRGSVCDVFFNDVRVPAENRIGAEGEGFRVVGSALDIGRYSVAARCVGQAQAALDLALAYAGQREAFGQPIGRFQMIQAKLADMVTQTHAARTLVRELGRAKDAGVERASMLASMAKLFASDVAMHVIMEAVQIHGGYGLTEEYRVGRFIAENKVLQIGEGTNEIHRVLIAEHALGLRGVRSETTRR